MNNKRKQKLIAVICLVFGVTVAVSLTLFALNQNINLFYTPTQVVAGEVPHGHSFRIGGMVEKGSITRIKDSLEVKFVLSDTVKEVTVSYTGILPDLFREGQGIVAMGKLNSRNEFVADDVLAKHDETYMPPEVKHALDQAEKAKSTTSRKL